MRFSHFRSLDRSKLFWRDKWSNCIALIIRSPADRPKPILYISIWLDHLKINPPYQPGQAHRCFPLWAVAVWFQIGTIWHVLDAHAIWSQFVHEQCQRKCAPSKIYGLNFFEKVSGEKQKTSIGSLPCCTSMLSDFTRLHRGLETKCWLLWVCISLQHTIRVGNGKR